MGVVMREVFSSLGARVLLLIAIALALMLGMSTYDELGERGFGVSLLVALALMVLASGAVWLRSASLVRRRIAALAGAAKQLGKGNWATRVGSKASGDALGQLAQSFDLMAERMQTKEAQLSRAERALRVLSVANWTLLHEQQGEQHLLEAMCRALGEAGGYRMVWAGYAVCDIEKNIRPFARWGSVAEGYFEKAKLTWSEIGSGCAPAGSAIRSGMPVVVQNLNSETGRQPWQDDALRCGCGACLALPLRLGERVIGVLNICAGEPDAFGDEELRVLSEAAADLSFGIARQRAEVEQACTKRGLKHFEERFRAGVEESLDR